jgi:hypothetical protein
MIEKIYNNGVNTTQERRDFVLGNVRKIKKKIWCEYVNHF